jgi:hypothetical protein
MYTALPIQPTRHARQPILAFRQTATPAPTPPPPTHDFLVMSACPDFTPELSPAYRERIAQRCA